MADLNGIPTLVEVETLARQAGEILREGFGRPKQVRNKGSIDLVTEVDHQSEAFLIHAIRSRYPSHQIIAEESGLTNGDADHCWYVDPLDGTVNFAHGLPIFSVSIGYAYQGQPRLGVVYDPIHDECYRAELGHGAWLNGKSIQVSGVKMLDQSLLVTGFPYDVRTNPANNLNHFSRFALITHGVRRLASAALDMCYVAAGRLDGYWEIQVENWDKAAGGLIVREAGGVATDIHGSLDFLSPSRSMVAANPDIHPQMLAVLKSD